MPDMGFKLPFWGHLNARQRPHIQVGLNPMYGLSKRCSQGSYGFTRIVQARIYDTK